MTNYLIPNLVQFANDADVFLSATSEDYYDAIISITPGYSSLQRTPTMIRVVVNAFLCQNGSPSDEMVSDYIDIEFEE